MFFLIRIFIRRNNKALVNLLLVTVISFDLHAQPRTIDFFIKEAREKNPDLKEIRNQQLANAIDSQLLRASLRTQVNFINNNSYAPIIRGYGYDEAITNIANITAIVQASRNISPNKSISLQFQSLVLRNRALNDSLLLTERDLVRSITEQYITAYGDKLNTEYTAEVLGLMRKEEAILKKLTQAGQYMQTDYLAFLVTLQQQEILYQQSIYLYNSDYLTINYLCGIDDTTVNDIEKPSLDWVVDDTAITSTPFYRPFITDSLRMQNEKALLAYEYKPKIGVYVDGGYNSSLQYLPYKNFGVSAGINVTIPIYDGHQLRMKLNKTQLEENTRQSKRDFFLARYNQEIARLKMQLRQYESLVAMIDHQVKFAHTLIEANNKLLEAGDITMKDYITAVSNYLAAKNLYTQNTLDRLKTISQLRYWGMR